eukprot:s2314_g13.t1
MDTFQRTAPTERKGKVTGSKSLKEKERRKERKGFGKKGRMNEVGYDAEADGTDMWYESEGSWWDDQSWMYVSQTWEGYDENWDNSWGETWGEQQDDSWQCFGGFYTTSLQASTESRAIGEIVDEEAEGTFKILVLTEMSTNCGALRIDGELVLKRFVARNLRPITPIAWNQMIGDQLFSEIASGAGGDVPAVDEPAEPAALPPTEAAPAGLEGPARTPPPIRLQVPDVPMHERVVEYPDGAPGDLVREMKEPDPDYRAPAKKAPAATPSASTKKPGELKIARQDPVRSVPAKTMPVAPKAAPKSSPKAAPKVSPTPSPSPTSPASETTVASPGFRIFPKTPRCPACDSDKSLPML